MSTEPKRVIMCNACVKQECRLDYPSGIPDYCLATRFQKVLEETSSEYSAPDSADIYKAAGRVTTNGYGRWSRIQEAVEFAKELKVSKVGLASCVGLIRELGLVAELFTGAGFTVIAATCQIGRVSPETRGVPELKNSRGAYCNPIAQAEILNSEGTQLNFIMGLCMGHDILFNRYSKAPVSTLIVKDRVTGNNPAAALYSSFHRRPMWKLYCDKNVD
ncbi:DUF1847 domain-containing protein [Chloroflexota bacterium]